MSDSHVNKFSRGRSIARRTTVALVAVATTVGLAACERKDQTQAPPPPPPAPVTVVMATAKDVPVYLDEIGRTTAFEVVNVQPQVTGKIDQILFKDGEDIALNKPLFTIEKNWFAADVAQAKALVKQRDAEVTLAKQEFKRVEGLQQSKAISEQEFEQKKSAVEVAEAQKAAAESAVATAELNLRYTDIKSPIAGRAGQRRVDVGNIVKANEATLVTIQNLDKLYVDFTTSERNLNAIRRHMKESGDKQLKTYVSVPGDAGKAREGKLTFLDTAVQAGSGTIKLRAEIENTDRQFWPQQFVNVRLVLETKRDAVLIPAAAVQVGQQGQFVYVVKEGSIADMRPVALGQRQDDLIVANDGVKAGERVIA
ncbi:MAG TPA: efflux RND transporter periplasmic adaptor subunit, partial [Tepidisphaeraceae bacterium]|nr:efflux RND transporter periplasmic adaptor subunit [Tepidisphaeraceae bacterium]